MVVNPNEVWPKIEQTENKEVKESPYSQKSISEKAIKAAKSPDIRKAVYSQIQSPELKRFTEEKDAELKAILEWKENNEKTPEKVRTKIMMDRMNPDTVPNYVDRLKQRIADNGWSLTSKEDINKAREELNQKIYSERKEKLDSSLTDKEWKPLYNKEGVLITKTEYQSILEKNTILNNLNTEKNPEFVKELLSVYWNKEIEGFSKVLAEKNVKTLEEADKVITEETLKRLKIAWKGMLDENGNPLSEEEKTKRLKDLEEKMKSNPDLATQVRKSMSRYQWISENEAKNVEAETLNLTWPEEDRSANLIKHFEWFVSTPYWDYKQWTHWFWTKATWPWDIISRENAHKELKDKLNNEFNLNNYLEPDIVDSLSVNQKAALTSFIYNLWPKKIDNFKPLLKEYSKWDYQEKQNISKKIWEKIELYNKAWWQILKWLVVRRKTEANIFIDWIKREDNKEDREEDKKSLEKNKK